MMIAGGAVTLAGAAGQEKNRGVLQYEFPDFLARSHDQR